MLMKRILFALFACGALATTQPLAAEDSWPQWRGPNRDGIANEKGLNFNWQAAAPKLLWTADGMGRGYASVSIADGVIYTTGNTTAGQSVVAVSDSGEVLWSQPLLDQAPKHGYPGARCTPAIDGEHLYVVGSHGAIACLRRGDGGVVWSRDFKDWQGRMHSGWGFSESPLVDGDWVLCTPGGDNAMIVALDKKTGEQVWATAKPAGDPEGQSIRDGAAYSSIVVSNACGVKQYVQLVGRGAVGVRASDGKLLWNYQRIANRTANIPTPLVDGDYVFCSTGYGTGSALLKLRADGDGVAADEQYFLDGRTMQNHHGGLILKDGHIYGGHGHNNGFPICVEMATGKIKWGGETRGPGGKSAAVVMVGDHLIFRYQTGEVAAIKAVTDGYQLAGSFKPDYQEGKSWAHPVVVDGKLYLREQNKLMCYSLRP